MDDKKVLGVCHRLAKRMDWDTGVVRSVFASSLLLSLIPSFGTTLLIYFLLHFIVPATPLKIKRKGSIDVEGRRVKS